jgi:hypothetical protein
MFHTTSHHKKSRIIVVVNFFLEDWLIYYIYRHIIEIKLYQYDVLRRIKFIVKFKFYIIYIM